VFLAFFEFVGFVEFAEFVEFIGFIGFVELKKLCLTYYPNILYQTSRIRCETLLVLTAEQKFISSTDSKNSGERRVK